MPKPVEAKPARGRVDEKPKPIEARHQPVVAHKPVETPKPVAAKPIKGKPTEKHAEAQKSPLLHAHEHHERQQGKPVKPKAKPA